VTLSNLLLNIKQLNKSYNHYPKPLDRLKELLTQRCYHTKIEVLKNISFTVEKGQSLAILGKNGAGKSTLLKMILGVALPNTGEIQCLGRITGLLELGAGFDENLSGVDNIFINGQLLGLSQQELQRKQTAIIQFAELGDYIDKAVKSYSSGMKMRLGFSIAIHAEPDCFVVDEALAVGDIRFQQKCIQHLQQFQQNGGALLLVSHDLAQVKRLCQSALILDQGEIVFHGEVKAACDHFQLAMLSEKFIDSDTPEQYQSAISLINAVWWQNDCVTTQLLAGEWAYLKIDLAATKVIKDLSLGFMIRDRFGVDLFGSSTHLQQYKLGFDDVGQYRIEFPIRLNLGVGEYTLFLALHDKDNYEDRVQFWEQSYLRFHIEQQIADSVGVIYCDMNSVQQSYSTTKV
jgi:lipopolysaccharide transport system ATP-binding protein